ncbi:MAG: MBL fold metallo-hydrolase [Verrucomicrobiales bacterium]|nr:MBL fold metallo-hydrolase [Verrucomicrobiales bacterium]
MQIHTIDLEFQDTRHAIAAFLVESGETKVLIETGPESTRDQLLGKLTELGCPASDLDAVFVTHIHLDHAGAAGWFAKEGIPLYVHHKGARHLVDPSRLIESARMIYAERFDSLWGEMTPAPEEQVHLLEGGETIEVGELAIEVLETPGHAFHHHAFAVNTVCFTGDAAGARLPGSEYISVTSAPPQFHLEHTLASVDMIAAREFEKLYLTHFGAIDDPSGHLKDYRRAVELNAEFIRQRLEEQMDPDSLRIAYQAFCMEQAFRVEAPREIWETLQLINGTDMCADGIRLFWEKQQGEGA